MSVRFPEIAPVRTPTFRFRFANMSRTSASLGKGWSCHAEMNGDFPSVGVEAQPRSR